MNERQMLEKLLDYDTPAVTNVVATYPGSETCLELYDAWKDNWYTTQSLRCLFPEIGRLAGHTVTCVFGLPSNDGSDLTWCDVIDELDASQKPTILVMKQEFPEEIADKVGLAGGNMTHSMQAVGCVGVICNGPSRDVDEIRPMGFQYLVTGVCAGHGPLAVKSVNKPVTVAGMEAIPGEIIHMDENGACKFPAAKLQKILDKLQMLSSQEKLRMELLSKAKTADDVRIAFSTYPG